MREKCPFCGHHPYEYVDVGVGLVPVAVTCCEFGAMLFDSRYADGVKFSLGWQWIYLK